VTVVVSALLATVPALAEASSGQTAVDPGSSKAAATSKRRDVRKRLGRDGGLVESRSGAAIYVPPGVMQRGGRVSITHLKGGRIDFHVAAPWRGTIAVTMPRLGRSEVVAHSVGDMWLPEGPPGQRTVWVTQLSIFDTAKAKAKAAACFLQLSKAKIAACLAKKLPTKIGKDLGSWLAEKLGHNCAAALISNGLLAPVATVWEDACAGSAGEGEFQFPGPAKEPPLPVTNAPAGSVQPETVNPQPAGPVPTPKPAPAPTPAPAPAPAPRVWNEQQGSLGANTFTNPYNASGMGPKIPPMAWVAVSCKVHAPQIASANPDGYWYRIASAPWSNA